MRGVGVSVRVGERTMQREKHWRVKQARDTVSFLVRCHGKSPAIMEAGVLPGGSAMIMDLAEG